jgi:hypothetical protein
MPTAVLCEVPDDRVVCDSTSADLFSRLDRIIAACHAKIAHLERVRCLAADVLPGSPEEKRLSAKTDEVCRLL